MFAKHGPRAQHHAWHYQWKENLSCMALVCNGAMIWLGCSWQTSPRFGGAHCRLGWGSRSARARGEKPRMCREGKCRLVFSTVRVPIQPHSPPAVCHWASRLTSLSLHILMSPWGHGEIKIMTQVPSSRRSVNNSSSPWQRLPRASTVQVLCVLPYFTLSTLSGGKVRTPILQMEKWRPRGRTGCPK